MASSLLLFLIIGIQRRIVMRTDASPPRSEIGTSTPVEHRPDLAMRLGRTTAAAPETGSSARPDFVVPGRHAPDALGHITSGASRPLSPEALERRFTAVLGRISSHAHAARDGGGAEESNRTAAYTRQAQQFVGRHPEFRERFEAFSRSMHLGDFGHGVASSAGGRLLEIQVDHGGDGSGGLNFLRQYQSEHSLVNILSGH